MRLITPCVVVLVGPAGAGKSTWAAAHFAPNEIVASDALRAAVGIDDGDQRASTDAFFLLDEIVSRRLARKLTTVIDTLGYEDELRASAIDRGRAAGLPVYAVGFDTSPEVCLDRNARRTRPVPKSVINKQLTTWKRLKPRLAEEGFDDVFIVVDEASTEVAVVPESMATAAEAAARQVEAARDLEFGLQISSFTWPDGSQATRDRLTALARTAEAAGFTSLWVMDHFRQIPQIGRAWDDMLESYTALSFLAGVTERIRLGVLVTGVPYRNPAHLGKIVATLDVLSGGRAICGLGLGWFQQEAAAYGWDWPTTSHRYDLLEDTLQLLPLLWGPGSPAFQGRVIAVPEALCYPRPIQERVPILVGGSGERRTLRLVAQYADMCNLFGDPTTIAHKVAVLRGHCEDVDRDPGDITVSNLSTALVGRNREHVADLIETLRPRNQSRAGYAAAVNAGTVEDHVGRFRQFAEAGVQLAVVNLPNLGARETLEVFARVIDAFAVPKQEGR